MGPYMGTKSVPNITKSLDILVTETTILGGMPSMDAQNMVMGGMASIKGNSAAMDVNGATNLANTKEKTPMCLVNELARYNKVNE